MGQSTLMRVVGPSLPLATLLYFCPLSALPQDSGDQGTMTRGDRAEIAITVRDSSGAIITAPTSVKLYKNGIPSDQSSTSHGRAFFIPRSMGDFTIVVEAAGYKAAQKDISLVIPNKTELDIYLQRESSPNETSGVPSKPILAPNAQEALSKGRQALREGKLGEAEKQLNKAANLAPGNPDVLYMHGMLYMKQNKWESAQSELQKSNQIAPNQPRVLSGLGMALCNQRKYEEAIPVLEKSLQLEPTLGWETDWALAKAYYFHEQFDQALKMAEQAHTTSHGSSAQVELLLAQCLTAVGHYDDSAQILREFVKSNANTPEAATAQRWLDNLAADGKIR